MKETFSETSEARLNFDENNFIKVNDYVNSKQYEKEYSSREKEFKQIKVKNVKKALSRLNSKKSLDQNKICNKLLKRASSKLHVVIAKLFNLLLLNDILQQDWLNSTIIMIGKKRMTNQTQKTGDQLA